MRFAPDRGTDSLRRNPVRTQSEPRELQFTPSFERISPSVNRKSPRRARQEFGDDPPDRVSSIIDIIALRIKRDSSVLTRSMTQSIRPIPGFVTVPVTELPRPAPNPRCLGLPITMLRVTLR